MIPRTPPQGALPARFWKNPRQDTTSESPELRGFSEEQLRFLAESLPQIAWTGLPNGYIDFMNSRWFEYTGLSEEETYNELKTAVHPDDLLRYRRCWERAVRTKKPYEVEYRFRAASGAYRWHLGRGLPVRDMQGHVIKWFGTCTDIHAQKEAEEEMRRLNEHLESIVGVRTAHLQQEIIQRRKTEQKYLEQLELLQRMIDTLPMAAVAVSSTGGILHANAVFRSLFAPDLPMEDLRDSQCVKILRAASERLPCTGWEAFLHRLHEPVSFCHELTFPDGRTFSLEHIPSTEGGGFLLLSRDISQEKKIETAKTEFMSLASHQLRTPLTSMRWSLGRLMRSLHDKLDPADLQLLHRAWKSTMTMGETIRTMLSISHVEAGLHAVSLREIDLSTFLTTVTGEYADACAEKKLKMVLSCTPGLYLATDPALLREILENLISNAVKYTPAEGKVTVSVAKESGKTVIKIRDTGLGIPVDQQKKVFGKFFRADNVARIDTEGSGLGLYLVYQLVHTLGGQISFVSDENKGTEFTMLFPG